MFTGIIEHVGRVSAVASGHGGKRLSIEAGPCAEDLGPGASLSVNGVCLTVLERNGATLTFDVIAETLRRSNLGMLRADQHVNLERSLRVGDRVDGHFVQGHVDALARVQRREASAEEFKLWLQLDDELRPYVVRQGAIALDGVSLTVAGLTPSAFSVALIPTTLERTTLGERLPGDLLNVETDLLARLVVHQMRRLSSDRGVGLAFLAEHGFVESP